MTASEATPEVRGDAEIERLRAENARLRHDLTELARLVVEQTAAEEALRRKRRRSDLPDMQDTISRLYPTEGRRR